MIDITYNSVRKTMLQGHLETSLDLIVCHKVKWNGVDESKSRDGEEFSQVFIIHLRSVYSKNSKNLYHMGFALVFDDISLYLCLNKINKLSMYVLYCYNSILRYRLNDTSWNCLPHPGYRQLNKNRFYNR